MTMIRPSLPAGPVRPSVVATVALGITFVLATSTAPAQATSSEPGVTSTVTDIALDSPRAGWHAPVTAGAAFSQEVNYPAASVNSRHDQADGARIRGRIVGATKGPAQLVVNGVAMPLRIEEDGSFDRPYLFPAGSNSVEVRGGDGGTRRRVQFLAHPDGATRARLRVILAWDTDHTDLDLHVIAPDGQHAWYGQRMLENGGAIDVDVTTGYGPEIFATPAPLHGPYLVFVNYYGGRGHDEADMTVANITIVSEEGTLNEKRENVQVPMRAPGELTLVKRFSYP